MQRGTRALTGVGLVVGGALLGMLALTVLPWYRSSLGGILQNGSTASEVRDSIGFYQGQSADLQKLFELGVSPLFFGGLGFVLLLLAALAGFAGAGVSGGSGRIFAAAAGVLSLAGLVLLALSIRFVDIQPIRVSNGSNITSPPSYLDFVTGSGLGAWAMLLAYLGIGIGAVFAAGSREELRELLRDDDDLDEPYPDRDEHDGRDETDQTDDDRDDEREDDRDGSVSGGSVSPGKPRGPADDLW